LKRVDKFCQRRYLVTLIVYVQYLKIGYVFERKGSFITRDYGKQKDEEKNDFMQRRMDGWKSTVTSKQIHINTLRPSVRPSLVPFSCGQLNSYFRQTLPTHAPDPATFSLTPPTSFSLSPSLYKHFPFLAGLETNQS